MTQDVRPVCMFCHTRFTLASGTTPTRCESWRSPDGAHVERRVATPEQRARMRLDGQPVNIPSEKTKTLSPTPFDAAALREGKPATGQTSLF
jgi:hypothetical protein